MNAYRLTPNRLTPTFLQAINPVWWMGDVERYPDWSWWRWFKRNPFSNLFSVGIGVADKHRTFYSPDTCTIWSPNGKARIAWTCAPWRPPLPLWSFKTVSHEAAWGWKEDGSLSITWRRRNATEAAHVGS